MAIKTVYHSRIDWWVWCVFIFYLTVVFTAFIGSPGWLTLIFCLLPGLLLIVLALGCWYEIVGDSLVIYQFFMPHRFPIDKIKEVKKTKGYLATAGLSAQRVSIKFSDRRVLKSSMPLEISPKDRDSFISQLKKINPEITVG